MSIQVQTCLNMFGLENLLAAVLARAVKYMCTVSEDLQVRISKRAQNTGGRFLQHFQRDHALLLILGTIGILEAAWNKIFGLKCYLGSLENLVN